MGLHRLSIANDRTLSRRRWYSRTSTRPCSFCLLEGVFGAGSCYCSSMSPVVAVVVSVLWCSCAAEYSPGNYYVAPFTTVLLNPVTCSSRPRSRNGENTCTRTTTVSIDKYTVVLWFPIRNHVWPMPPHEVHTQWDSPRRQMCPMLPYDISYTISSGSQRSAATPWAVVFPILPATYRY